MFERFSQNSIRVTVLAHKMARKFRAQEIGFELIIYAIAAEGSTKEFDYLAVTKQKILHHLELKYGPLKGPPEDEPESGEAFASNEIPFSKLVEDTLKESGNVLKISSEELVEPFHLLQTLTTNEEVKTWLTRAMSSFSELPPQYVSFAREANPVGTSSSKKRIEDWFTTEAIGTVSKAFDIADTAGAKFVRGEHIISASIELCDWLPTDLKAQMESLNKQTIATRCNESASAFAEEMQAIFVKAHKEALVRASNVIAPEHLLLASLHSIRESIDSPAQQIFDSVSLYSQASMAIADHLNCHRLNRTLTETKSLSQDKNKATATSRLIKLLKHVFLLADRSANRKITVHHILQALVKSAQESEVDFIGHRATQLEYLETKSCTSDVVEPSLDGSTVDAKLLTSLTKQSLEHAKRLQSNRLDINHLALALLDRDETEVSRLVTALGEHSTHGSLKRRLEWCLHFQKFKEGHQAEEGIEIDLRKLSKLYP